MDAATIAALASALSVVLVTFFQVRASREKTRTDAQVAQRQADAAHYATDREIDRKLREMLDTDEAGLRKSLMELVELLRSDNRTLSDRLTEVVNALQVITLERVELERKLTAAQHTITEHERKIAELERERTMNRRQIAELEAHVRTLQTGAIQGES